MKEFYAYIHVLPDATCAADVFYVGKGTRRRSHGMADRSDAHKAVTAICGRDKVLVGTMACSSEDVAYDLERGLIRCLRRMGAPLVNRTDGGGGASGTKRSEETKAKIKALVNRPHVRAAHAERLRRDNPPTWPSVKAKRTEQFKANWADKAIAERMRAGMRNAWTDERKAAFSRGNPSHDPEVNAKKSATLKGYIWPTLHCPHCGKSGVGNTMMRHHFDRCKKRENG